MAKKRSVKVYGQSGYKYRETPMIMLKGLWLKEAGFDIGDFLASRTMNLTRKSWRVCLSIWKR